jgi:hypothetical protein
MKFDKDFVIPKEPNPANLPMSEEEASKEAFYAAGSYGEENVVDQFQQMYTELIQKGYSQAYSNAKEKWEAEQDANTKLIIPEIISDPTMDKQQKIDILNLYNVGGHISKDIKDKYMERTAVLDYSETLEEQKAQDEVIEVMPEEVQRSVRLKEEEDSSSFLEKVGGEIASVVQLGLSIVPEFIKFANAAGYATAQKIKEGKVDWAKVAEVKEQTFTEDGKVTPLLDWKVDAIAEWMGIDDEYQESIVNKGLSKVGQGFEWLAEKAAENNFLGAKTKEEALFYLEAIGWALPPAYQGAKSVLRRTGKDLKFKADSQIDNTISSNPKLAGDLEAGALKEGDGGKTAKALGTDEATIIQESILPDNYDKVKSKLIPDIYDKIKESNYTPAQQEVMLRSIFDTSIVNIDQRLRDYSIRRNISDQTNNVFYNQANSRVTMNENTLSGTMRFTQDANYAYQNKTTVTQAYNNLKDLIDKLPESERGTLSIVNTKTQRQYASLEQFANDVQPRGRNQYMLEWEFNKKYDLLSDSMYNIDSVKQTFFGKGEKLGTFLAHTPIIGENLFGTGVLPVWVEQAKALAQGKAGYIKTTATKETNRLIAQNRDLGPQVQSVIKQMEEKAKDTFTRAELRDMYPDLTSAKIDKLHEIQQSWRASNDFLYELTNQGEKVRLNEAGFTRAVYLDNEYAGVVVKEIEKITRPPKRVYDVESKKMIDFVPDKSKGNVLDSNTGARLVQLEKPAYIDGAYTRYAVAGGKTVIGDLPKRVVPKLPGHSYRQMKGHFFVDIRPRKVEVDGRLIQKAGEGVADIAPFTPYTRTKGVAKSRHEANLLKDELAAEYKDHDIIVREAREDRLADFTEEYKLNADNYRNALSRNEKIRSLTGEPELVDPLTALNNAARDISRNAAYGQWNKAFESKFIQDFKEFLPNGEFPTNINQITKEGMIMNAERTAKFRAARDAYTRHTHFRSHANPLDKPIQATMHALADVMEKIPSRVARESVAPIIRDAGNLGSYPVTGFPKKLGSLLFISLQMPVRHLVIQPMLALEQALVFPKTFKKTAKMTPVMTMELLSDNPVLKGYGDKLKNFMTKEERVEFNRIKKALKETGVLESIDQNLIVQELFEGPTPRIQQTLSDKLMKPGRAITKALNTSGFAAGELMNRVALFVQNVERWKAKNPGKKWDTKSNIDNLAFESWKQSGAMTSAGALAFQRYPFLSFLTQFMSINQKLSMNFLQDTATNLTRKERAKLAVSRTLIHGVEYGAPLGLGKMLVDHFMQDEDPENIEVLRTGALDLITNAMMEAATGEETGVTISKDSSTQATNFILDYVEQGVQVWNHVTGSGAQGRINIPALTAVDRVTKTLESVYNVFKRREAVDMTNPEIASKMLGEVVKVSSGGSNFMKGLTALTYRDIFTKNGQALGLDITTGEALLQMAGFRTQRELDLWEQRFLQMDRNAKIKEAVTGFDSEIKSILSVADSPEHNAGNLMGIIGQQLEDLQKSGLYTDAEISEIIDGVLAKDRARAGDDLSTSMIGYFLNKYTGESIENLNEVKNRFKTSKNPFIQDMIKAIDGQLETFIEE